MKYISGIMVLFLTLGIPVGVFYMMQKPKKEKVQVRSTTVANPLADCLNAASRRLQELRDKGEDAKEINILYADEKEACFQKYR